jgi:hypothetical protein
MNHAWDGASALDDANAVPYAAAENGVHVCIICQMEYGSVARYGHVSTSGQ